MEKLKILTKSYKDGILDCLAIIDKWYSVGITNVPILYIKEPMERLLTAELEISQNKHYDQLKIITEKDVN